MDCQPRIHVCDDPHALSRAAAAAFVGSANAALSTRPHFTVALSGGVTPTATYVRLASEFRNDVAWHRVHVFWVDERYVRPDHLQSNYRMVADAMLRPLSLPPANVHAPDTTSGDPEASARRYEADLEAFFGSDLPRFDWMLLGMGDDGHVASLFPGAVSLEVTNRLVIGVEDSPKPPPVRLTMTLPLINAARAIHFLVSGPHKRAALARVLAREDDELPASRVQPCDGTVDWWVSREAWLGASPV